MVSEDTKRLDHELVSSRFTFMPRGTLSVDEIYSRIRKLYPDLCDDGYPCLDNCLSRLSRPE